MIVTQSTLNSGVLTQSQPDLSSAVNKKTEPVGSGPGRHEPKEPRCLDGRDSETSIKFYRGYTISVRGQIPGDIEERVSKLHASALVKSVRLMGREAGFVNRGPNAESDDASDQH